MNHTAVLRTPLDAVGFKAKGLKPLPVGAGVFVTNRRKAALESPALRAPFPFDDLVGSWNAELPSGARLEMQASVRVRGRWSKWYGLGAALGRSGSYLEMRSPEGQEDAVGRVAVDTLRLKQSADTFRYRILINAPGHPVILRLTAMTVSEAQAPAAPARFQPGPWIRELKVRGRSQMIEAAAIRRDICSPTSVAAVLEYWGRRLATAEMARLTRDQTTGDFGNWTFNTAAAAALGLEARVCRLESLEDLAAEISGGRPVVTSLTFGPGELHGSPLPATRGHLMVVTGFTDKGDVIVMDPAAPTNRSTRRIYSRSQFHRAWRVNKRGLSYIVEPFSSLRLAVGVPAADLRSAPRPRAERLTQLLYGETVTARAAKGGWLRVEAEEQRHLVRGKWCGYPGWVRADALTGARPPAPTAVIRSPSVELCSGKRHLRLSLGTRLAAWPRGRGWIARLLEGSSVLVPSGALAPLARVPQKDHCRRLILKTAAQLLGRTYHWGGHSGVQPRHDTGVDCSGLTSLAYRACGIELPRDAHQQMLLARALSRRELKPADLIFLTAGGASRRITHVMLYEGGERILESRHSAGRILRCSFSQRFGVPLRRLESGTAVLDLTFPRPRRRRIYFGSYL